MNTSINPITLIGKTILSIIRTEASREDWRNNADTITIVCETGETYRFWHERDCCESVEIYDITGGSLSDLIGKKLIDVTEEISSERWPDDVQTPEYLESYTWTTHTFKTESTCIRVRWLGESNGYYSESVSLDKIH